MMSAKWLSNSSHYYHFIDQAFNINDYIFSTSVTEAVLSVRNADSYKFMVTLINKKFPFSKGVYWILKSVLDSLLRNKMFNTLLGLKEQTIHSLLTKVAKDLRLLDIAIDIIAFFTIGFKFFSISTFK